jgi:predicted PurR-regulated permease PerM
MSITASSNKASSPPPPDNSETAGNTPQIDTQPVIVTTAGSGVVTAGGLVLGLGALYFGRDIFVPFSLAVLLSFALAPLVKWLRRLRAPKIAAILVAVTLAGSVIGGIGFVVAGQVVQLASNLPTYQQTIRNKLQSLRSTAAGGGVVSQVTETIKEISEGLAAPAAQNQPPSSASPSGPISVRIEPGSAQPVEIIQTVLGPLIAPLATAGLVIVFVIFILIEREDLRDRFLKLVGAGDLQTSTEAVNEAGARVSRYLLMQLLVNLTYGVPLGMGLYFIGVPNALLWGLLAALLRFVPYLGPFLAALFPVALAFAVDPGWSMLGWVVALFLVLELISNNVVEPWLYGTSTGLSSLAIIMSAIFWTSLWGPVGLLLSTPLTVCLVVLGRYVPQLEFLGTLLGSDPALTPHERFYQRLMGGNVEEAVEIAEGYVDERGLLAFADDVAIPALRQAETDRRRSTSDINYRRIVSAGASAVLRDIEETLEEQRKKKAEESAETESPEAAGLEVVNNQQPMKVLGLAGRTDLDQVGLNLLERVLRGSDPETELTVLPPSAVAQDAIGRLDLTGIDVAVISYFHPQPETYARYLVRRLKRRAPHLKIIVCTWNAPKLGVSLSQSEGAVPLADAVVATIADASQALQTLEYEKN